MFRHACALENFNPETTTKRSFCAECAADAGDRRSKGGSRMAKFFANLSLVLIVGLVLAVLIALFPDFGLPPSDRRSAERRPAVASRLLRHHLDRPALLFQLRADADHADGPRRAEAGRLEIYRAEGAVLFPLGRGLHGPDRPAARLVIWRARRGADPSADARG